MTNAHITRRRFLKTAVTLPLVASIPSFGFAKALPEQRKFLFLMASGGWDSTLVFEPSRNANGFNQSISASLNISNTLQWNSSVSRPSVDQFFHRWGQRTSIINGIHTQSSGHVAASNFILTGDADPSNPDWPTLLDRGSQAVASQPHSNASFMESLYSAVESLRKSRNRSEILHIPGNWDTHNDNKPQSIQFENFFHSLNQLFHYLEKTPGSESPRLLDEIVVVAISELGRTPALNAAGGKDHWPYTSALISGPGIAGGRTIGVTDDGLEALPVDFQTGVRTQRGDIIQGENLGATLLRLGGLPLNEHLQGVQYVSALLS